MVAKSIVVYYESLKRELKTKPIYEFRCDERLQTKSEEFTRLACTQRSFASYRFVYYYYESLKRALMTKTIYGYRCDERLKTNVEESTV